jgi:hypothetical protein
MYNTDLPNRTELPSSKQLLRSTIIAIIIAAALLVTVVLPSEYGIDLTGIGRHSACASSERASTSFSARSAWRIAGAGSYGNELQYRSEDR